MRQERTIVNKIDWVVIAIYLALVIMGWLNIYAAVYDEEMEMGIFNLALNSGKQLIWIATSVLIIIVIMTVDFRFYDSFAFIVYGIVLFMLILVLFAGTKVAGSTSWFAIGGFRVQPSEFAKFATALAVAKYMSKVGFKLTNFNDIFITACIIAIPPLLIIVQGDTGTALVFGAFVIVLYREGLNPTIIVIGLLAIALFVLTLIFDQTNLIIGVAILGVLVILIGKKKWQRIVTVAAGMLIVISVIWSVDYFVNEVLKPHQQNRIKALINPEQDPLGGNMKVVGNAELLFPPPIDAFKDTARLGFFLDIGNVFDTSVGDPDFNDLRTSVGFAASWLSPIGALSFSIAEPLDDEAGDETETFQFNLGQTF